MMNKFDYGSDGDYRMCIYKITNTVTQKSYIGQTRQKSKKRWQTHVAKDKRNVSYINRTIQKYGKENFIFEVIDIAENLESLGKKEEFWITELDTLVPNGYNLKRGGFHSPEKSEDFKEKLRAFQAMKHAGKRSRGYIAKHRTEEEKSEAIRIQRERMSLAKIGKPSPMKGKKHSEESKIKSSKSKTGIEVPAKWKKVIRSDGVVFESIKSASIESGVSRTGIQAVLAGRAKTAGGFSFRYLE